VGLDVSKNQYYALGTGLNGAAYSVGKDNCNNIYFAGAFTTANGIATGPIAVWKSDNAFFAANASGIQGAIQSIFVDCNPGSCVCDLWIGGIFSFTASDGLATNVARFSATTNTWSNLGGVAAHGISTVAATLPPVTTVKRVGDLLYVAGTFSGLVKSYTISTNTWGSALLTSATPGTPYGLFGNVAVIHDMRTVTISGTTGVFVGGNFASGNCKFVCGYVNNAWAQIGANNQPTGPVFGLSYDNATTLYISGNFSVGTTGSVNIAATTLSSTLTGGDWNFPGASISITLPPILRIEALDPKQFGYSSGSYAYGGFAGLGLFYDADVRIHFPFGTGGTPSNTANTFWGIVATPYFTNSGIITGASVPLIIMCLAVLMFFFSN
jgi:hypothetical protein